MDLSKKKRSKLSKTGYFYCAKKEKLCANSKVLQEFGGMISVYMIIISSVSLLFIVTLCNEQSCSFTELPDFSVLTKFERLFTNRSFKLITNFIILLSFCTLCPYFGKIIEINDGKRSYNANSIFCFATIIIIAIFFNIFYAPVFEIVHQDYISVNTVTIIYGFMLNIAIYIRNTRSCKKDKNPRQAINDSFVGKGTNSIYSDTFYPKLIAYRIAIIGLALVEIIWIYHEVFFKSNHETINPALLIFSGTRLIYALECIYNEQFQICSSDFLQEPRVFLTNFGFLVHPIALSLSTKIILDQNKQLPWNLLVLVLILFLIGLNINSESIKERNMFKKDPLDLRIAYFKYIPTTLNKPLLISGWLGFVRHPRCLGELMMHISWCIGCYDSISIGYILIISIFIIYRMRLAENHCHKKYGKDWEKYCQKVPYCILPWIY